MEYNSRTTSKGMGIKFTSLNVYMLVDTLILIVLNALGIRDNVFKLLENLGWVDMLRPIRGFENFTYEFLSSIVF
jgi:hypothetical protein